MRTNDEKNFEKRVKKGLEIVKKEEKRGGEREREWKSRGDVGGY